MQAVVDRLADVFAAEPDNVAKAAVWLLLLYTLTLVPLLSWTFSTLLSRSKPAAQVSEPPSNGHLELPSPEQTALLIRNRRSIFTKDLSGETVDRNTTPFIIIWQFLWRTFIAATSTVQLMLEAANWAPTHGKTEPWRFVILGSEPLQEFITVMQAALSDLPELGNRAEKVAKLQSKRSKMRAVAWAIVICFKRQAAEKRMPEWEELAATAAAVQNMHLMATSLGAAGYWTSWGPEEARESARVKQWLGLEHEDRCIGVFLLGRSDRASGYKAKRGPISEKVTWRP